MNNSSISFKRPDNIDEGLILYYHHNSYYSQKVLLALYEKKIKFTPYEIDVLSGEHYSSWFLDLNPKAEVPVLQNGLLIIPESSQILNYLEANYSNENQVRLIPRNIDAKVLSKVIHISKLINRVPVGAVSLGSFIHDEFTVNSKPPFIGPIRKSFLHAHEIQNNLLKKSAEINSVHKERLLEKSKFVEKKLSMFADRDQFIKLINAVDSILKEIEEELKSHDAEWLCCDEFTLADVSFAVLLNRLSLLGLEKYLWSDNKPHIVTYYAKITKRESFIKSLPTTVETWKTVWSYTPKSYKIGAGILGISTLGILGTLALSKKDVQI